MTSELSNPLDAGAFTAVTSEITLVETIVGPRKAGDALTENDYRMFLTPSANLNIEPITLPVLEKVIELRALLSVGCADGRHQVLSNPLRHRFYGATEKGLTFENRRSNRFEQRGLGAKKSDDDRWISGCRLCDLSNAHDVIAGPAKGAASRPKDEFASLG